MQHMVRVKLHKSSERLQLIKKTGEEHNTLRNNNTRMHRVHMHLQVGRN